MLKDYNQRFANKFIITEDLIGELADQDIIDRGWAYFQEDKVSNLVLKERKISARVDGSQRYKVVIEFRHKELPDVYCSCPYDWGGACKHIVAVLYAAMDYIEDQSTIDEFNQEIIEADPAERKQKKNGSNGNGKQLKWTKKLENLLLTDQQQLPQSTQSNWKLIYLIQITSYSVVLHACRQKIKKDGLPGDTSIIYFYDLTDVEHYDSLDRLLVPLIISSLGVTVMNQDLRQNKNSRVQRSSPAELFSSVLQHLERKDVFLTADGKRTPERVIVHSEPLEVSFILTEHEGGDLVTAKFYSASEEILVESPVTILLKEPLWIMTNSQIYRLTNADEATIRFLEKGSWNMRIPAEERETFRKTALPRLLERYNVQGKGIATEKLTDGFSKRLYLEEQSSFLTANLRFSYSGYEVPTASLSRHVVMASEDLKTYYRIERNLEAEFLARREVIDTYMVELSPFKFSPRQMPLDWIMQKLPALVQNGFEVYGKENLKSFKIRSSPSLNVSISSGIDWFDVSMNIDYDGIKAMFKDVFQSIQKSERFVKLSDGSLGLIPEEWIAKFKRAFTLTDAKTGEWKLSRAHFSLIDQLFDERDLMQYDETFKQYKEKFRSFQSVTPCNLPREFAGELRPYQKSGYDWLQFLKEFQFNGCLADDMGLGKTVQTLALLQHEYGNGATHPSLIVVPTSIVFNWLNEAKRFAPSLDILCHTGNKRIRRLEELSAHNVIVTSYGILRRDILLFKEQPFHYVILDESQNIKNPGSQNSKAVKVLNARHRLALTGTPVENNLVELWSQFDFLNPGLLGSRNGFIEQFVRPIERNKDNDAVDMLKKTIYPFILRRTKEVVAKELPPKTETVKYCEMEKQQRTLYHHWRDYYRAAILDSIDSVGLQNSKFKVLEGLVKLRQVCCHPQLVEEKYSGSSGKYEVWKQMLEELLAENHKALIFSQFVKMLRILSGHCDDLDVDYEYLDGSTRDREERVNRFQENENVKLFLISLKAGGTGLNLTAADYVIHYDPWWNPAVEMQATDRTHRIGQTKNIFSYKLITKDTIEEKILSLQEKKKELVQSIITAETGLMKQITREDIEMLFE